MEYEFFRKKKKAYISGLTALTLVTLLTRLRAVR